MDDIVYLQSSKLDLEQKGDTVIMDAETYGKSEDELAFAFKLSEAERAWANGDEGYTVDELETSLNESIERGALDATKHGA